MPVVGPGLPDFNAEALDQGQVPEQRLREVTVVSAPAEIALRLDLDEGTSVVARRRLYLIDGQPVAFCDSYYPAELAKGTVIAKNLLIRGGVHAVIEDPHGPIRRQVARSVDDLMSRMPTPHEVEALRLPPGVPVIRILRTVYDADDRPLEVRDTVTAADCPTRYRSAAGDDQSGLVREDDSLGTVAQV